MPRTSDFPRKLWELARTDQTGSIEFNLDGDGFYIDPAKFRENILAAGVMRSGRYGSFVRQLNFYGFYQGHQAVPRGPMKLYRNDNFRADRADLLVNIKRTALTTGRRRGPQKGKNENFPPLPNYSGQQDVENWILNNPEPPGFTPEICGFGQQLPVFRYPENSGFNQETSGFNQETSGFNQETSGFNQETFGFNQETSGFNQETSGFNQETSGFNQETSGFNQETSGFNQETSGFNQETSGFNQETFGFQFGPPPAYRHTPMAPQQNFASMPGCSSWVPPPLYRPAQVIVEPIATEQFGQDGQLSSTQASSYLNPLQIDEAVQLLPDFFY